MHSIARDCLAILEPRAVIDGLRQPKCCEGVMEGAQGLWIRHADMQPGKHEGYALRLRVGAVTRQFGYLLELHWIAPERKLPRLRQSLTMTCQLLHPILPKDGFAPFTIAPSNEYVAPRTRRSLRDLK